MELREFYRSLLETLGYVVNERGDVFTQQNDTLIPVTIKAEQGKRLVVPFDDVLRNPDWDNTVAFHPLSENVVRTDSSIFKWLQNASLLYLNANTGWIMSQLLYYCASTDAQKDMNHKQKAFLEFFPNCDEESYNRWNKIQDKMGNGNFFVKVITLRDKKLKGEGYSRTAQVSFPFYKELKELYESKSKERSIWGVQLRKKDVEGYLKLFEYIFKHLDDIDTGYSFGTRSMIAPSFHALVNALARVAKDIRAVACLLKLDGVHDLNWTKSIDDLNAYRNIVPPLAGNEGNVTETERRQIAAQGSHANVKVTPPPAVPQTTIPQQQVSTMPMKPPVQTAPPIQQVQPQVQQPVSPVPATMPVQQPVAATTPGKLSTSQLFGCQPPQPLYQPQPVQQQVVYQQPMQYAQPQQVVYTQPMVQPQVGYQQPVQQQPQNLYQAVAQRGQPIVQPQPMMQPMGYGQPQMGYPQPMFNGYAQPTYFR